MQRGWAGAGRDGRGDAGGCDCPASASPPAQHPTGAAAWSQEGREGVRQPRAWLGAAPRASVGTRSSPRGPTAARLDVAKHCACPSPDPRDRHCWTSMVPSPCSGPHSPDGREQRMLRASCSDVQTLSGSWGSGPLCGSQTLSGSWGSGPLHGSWEHPGLRQRPRSPALPLRPVLPGRALTSPRWRCPQSGQGSGSPVPPAWEVPVVSPSRAGAGWVGG